MPSDRPTTSAAKPYRIALVTFSSPWPDNPYTGQYNLLQAQGLQRLGFEVEIFVCALRFPRVLELIKPSLKRLNDRPREWVHGGIRGHAVPGIYAQPMWVRRTVAPRLPALVDWSIGLAWGRGLRRALGQFAPDAIYVHDGILLGGVTTNVAASLHVPFGIIEHDAIVWSPTTSLGRHYAAIARRAAAVFGVGLPSVWALRERFGLSNARFAPNGIARATEEQLRTPRPEKYRGKKIVLTAGSTREFKGHAELVRAFAEADIPNSIILLAGDPLRPDVAALVQSFGLQDRVEHLGRLSQSAYQQCMVWADVFALPSRMESFGMVYGEAIAAGTPVILTTACGIAPILQQGVHGWILAPFDHAALVNALREALIGEKRIVSDAGRALIGDLFTWDMSARAVAAGLRGEQPPPGLDPDLSNAAAFKAALPSEIA